MTSQDSCMNIKFLWPLSVDTDWEEKLPSPVPVTTWTKPLVTSVSPHPPWINTTSKLPDKSEITSKHSNISTSTEDSPQSSETLNKIFTAPSGEACSKTTWSRETLHTDGNSMLRLLLTTCFQTLQTHFGNGQPSTVCSQERPCSLSLNTQDGSIWEQTLCQCLKCAHNCTVSTKESVTSKETRTHKVNIWLIKTIGFMNLRNRWTHTHQELQISWDTTTVWMFCWRTERKWDRLSFQTWTWQEWRKKTLQETSNQLITTTTGVSTTLIDWCFDRDWDSYPNFCIMFAVLIRQLMILMIH